MVGLLIAETRRGAARGGAAKITIGSNLKEAWKTKLGARLTAPVVANGLLITATPDTHEVHALDADTGAQVWSYTAGGAVNSPPTIAQGRAVFGSADGWVYCLRATDGKLAWRYRAAPVDRRIVAYGKVESIWPVHGSVLVQDGVVYAVAGRTAQMDGLSFCALDLGTGKKVVEQQVEKISEYRLDGLPAWDGLIAAGNCLYMTMQDGTVMCMKGD